MIVRSSPKRPAEQTFALGDWQVVDARDPARHQAIGRKLPILIAVRAMPGACIIMPFIGEAHRDPVAVMGPQTLDQPIVLLTAPLPSQKGDDSIAPLKEFGAVPPLAVLGVGKRHARGITAIPAILGGADLLQCGLMGERREGRSRHQQILSSKGRGELKANATWNEDEEVARR